MSARVVTHVEFPPLYDKVARLCRTRRLESDLIKALPRPPPHRLAFEVDIKKQTSKQHQVNNVCVQVARIPCQPDMRHMFHKRADCGGGGFRRLTDNISAEWGAS